MNKDEIIEKLLDEIDEEYPNESYSNWDIAEYVFDKLQPKWIKINSEADLPKDNGSYFIYSVHENNPYYKFRIDIFTGRLSNLFYDGVCAFTHYQPIIKPNPPIY